MGLYVLWRLRVRTDYPHVSCPQAYDKAEAAKVVTGDKMVTDGIEDAEVVEE